jgi:hypothetical protein
VHGTSDGWSSYTQYTDDVLHNIDDCVPVSWKHMEILCYYCDWATVEGYHSKLFLMHSYSIYSCYLWIGNITHLFFIINFFGHAFMQDIWYHCDWEYCLGLFFKL